MVRYLNGLWHAGSQMTPEGFAAADRAGAVDGVVSSAFGRVIPAEASAVYQTYEIPCGIERADVQDVNISKIQKFARAPLSPDDIYTFPGVISTDAVDAYFTHMDISSLRRFVADFKNNRSLLSSHYVYQLPIGGSYDAELEDIPEGKVENVPATKRVRVFWYMIRDMQTERGVNTDQYIKGIESGVYHRMSIGFGGKDLEFKCDIDGSDIWDWDSEYYPGMKLEGELKEKYGPYVTYGVYNANAREGSLVYSNATPGAVVERVQRMITARKVPPVEIGRLGTALGVEFDRPAALHRGIGQIEKGPNMTPEELIRQLLSRAGAKFSKDTRTKLETALSSGTSIVDTLAELLEISAEEESEEDRAIRARLSNRGIDSAAKQGDVFTLADQGREYVDSQIAEAVRARVAVMGNGYNAEAYKARLEKMAAGGDLAGVRDEIEVAKKQLGATFTPGRVASAVQIANDELTSNELYEIRTERS